MHRRLVPPCAFAILAGLLFALASCASTPLDNLALDLTGIDVPVMLGPVQDPAKSISVTLEAGYASRSVTSSSSYRGTVASSTVTMKADIQRPFRDQLMPTMLQQPDWLSIDSLSLAMMRQLTMSSSAIDCRLLMSVRAPVKK